MKKRIITLSCAIMMAFSLLGCGCNSTNEQSKYPKEVTKTLDAYFKAYENCNGNALDEIACPTNNVDSSMVSVIEKYNNEPDYPDMNHYYFLREANIFCFEVFVSRVDYLKMNVPYDDYHLLFQNLSKKDIKFEYEITNIATSKECNTISYASGLETIEEDANDYISNKISPNVSDWYVIQADVTWTMDGIKFGWDNQEIQGFFNQYNIDLDASEIYQSALNSGLGKDYTFIVYELNDKWYVYHPKFMTCKNNHQLLIDFVE